MSLQVFGADKFTAALERTFYLAEYAEKQLRLRSNWEITSSAKMAVMTFRYVLQGETDSSAEGARQIDALNRAIAARMQEQGFALVLTTELRGQTVLPLHNQSTHHGRRYCQNGGSAGRTRPGRIASCVVSD